MPEPDRNALLKSGPYKLIGPNSKPRLSPTPGALGGHRGTKIFGRLDCRAALRAIALGGYVKKRVFFANSSDAVCAGYRPCAVCLPDEYLAWKVSR
jgi:hypothetical protein